MWKIFVPKCYLNSFKDVDIKKLEDRNIKILVLDIDNTLVPYDVAKPSEEAAVFMHSLVESSILPVVISNNHKERVALFLEDFPTIKYYYEAKKPLQKIYKTLMKDFMVKPEEIATIGDQLMTDVFGANRCGCYSILTHPLVDRDIFSTKINRILEKIVFWILKKKGLFDREKATHEM